VNGRRHRIGFVSTRFAGTDGVSLETEKWAHILATLGHECFYFAGESDRPETRTHLVPEAHFNHPDVEALNRDLFGKQARSTEVSRNVQALRSHLKEQLHTFVRTFGLELLIVENALSLPMNVPLGLAVTELIAETGIPTIGHHHDFAWEREHFAVSAAADYLRAAFPPTLPSIRHVVINSIGSRQLALRTGANSTLIPNIMDFDSPPPEPDSYGAQIRQALGINPGEKMILQPTRIVPRKRIEHAIELTRRIELESVLVISHAAGDEGQAYAAYLREYADMIGACVVFAADIIHPRRDQVPDGRPVFSLADAYQQADLITYPSTVEGFGNAFLETIYYRRPIVVHEYAVFRADIRPKGFRVIAFEDFITGETVSQARQVLRNPDMVAEMVEHNYELGRRHYSYRAAERQLAALLGDCLRT